MSRRHKETDIQATQPYMTESAADIRQQTTSNSTTNSSQVQRGLESVREFHISEESLHHLINVTVDDAIDKALAGYCKNIGITINKDNSISVNGKAKLHKSAFEYISSILHAGNFDECFDKASIDLSCDDYPSPDIEDKPRGRGRPVVEQLCSMFRDAAIWPMVKTIFRRIYKKSIQKATNLAQYLVCIFCSFFRINKTEESYGRVRHFYDLMKIHFSKNLMPKLRTLQSGVQWLTDKTKTFFRCVNRKAEEAKHRAWEELENVISRHMIELAPRFACNFT